ncbi:unannotated protein [freshwater metagenome]|jgi:predicted metal-dependent phosphoesterase TrpH|uniref:Unannotated protein n=1 Tax=freshwater metagenome TaxID=449393 RepID=A0A6J7QZD6_9ZZZZ
MHTICSDGTDSPEELAAKVVAAGLSAAALTDHDTTEGHSAYGAYLEAHGVEFVPGVEISCRYEETGQSAHVLCYFVEEGTSPLQEALVQLRADRAKRNIDLFRLLHEMGYAKLDRARIEELAEKPLEEAGRPHIAQALFEAYPDGSETEVPEGLPQGFQDTNHVFSALLGNDKPAYVPKANLTIGSAAELAAQSGAVAVIAHPIITFCSSKETGMMPLEEQRTHLDQILGDLAQRGVVGAEAYYSRHSPEQVAMMLDLCDKHGLVPTGGSDFHGENKKDLSVGIGMTEHKGSASQLRVPESSLELLKARRSPASSS